jgi:hypothetical protein
MSEKDCNRPHEPCFGRIVQRCCASAVVILTRKAFIVHMRAMKERGDNIRDRPSDLDFLCTRVRSTIPIDPPTLQRA